jgi:hypothetical protein
MGLPQPKRLLATHPYHSLATKVYSTRKVPLSIAQLKLHKVDDQVLPLTSVDDTIQLVLLLKTLRKPLLLRVEASFLRYTNFLVIILYR